MITSKPKLLIIRYDLNLEISNDINSFLVMPKC
jgi:hypothetical protein